MIERAIERHGARHVYEAACAYIDGQGPTALIEIELDAQIPGDAYRIMSETYPRMSREDQAAHYWDASELPSGRTTVKFAALKSAGISKSLANRILAFLFIIYIPLVATAGNGIIADLANTLAVWKPQTIEQSGNYILVSLPQSKVSDTMYFAVVGVACASAVDWQHVEELRILNQWSRQGYVLEQPGTSCPAIASASIADAKIVILEYTHWH